jgi:predicted DNA-binding transcriptional regulator
MFEQEVHVSIAQRINIKFLSREGVKPAEILRRLTEQFKEETLSRVRVFAWHKQFVEVVSTLRMRAMIADPTDNNIRRVQQFLEGDRRLRVAEIAGEVRISYGSAFAIITDELGFRKVCARWVPCLLTSEKKKTLQVCQRILTKCQEESGSFLTRIITCDET